MLNENGDIINEKRDILREIADKTKERINKEKEKKSLEEIQKEAFNLEKGTFAFEKALKLKAESQQEKDMAFICEVKKASPSKGLIAPDFPYTEIAKDYEQAGATAISCLTEPFYFQGENRFLEEISAVVTIPILRKDFFIDTYMIYEAKLLGASAILLICSILNDEELKEYFAVAEELGLSCLFEAHDEEEVERAIAVGARVIGVNNRNLKTFQLDLNLSVELRKLVGEEILFVSESGIQTREDIALLEKHQVNAVLIGETLMRAENKKEILDTLRGR